MSNKQNRLYTNKPLKENLAKDRPHAEIVTKLVRICGHELLTICKISRKKT